MHAPEENVSGATMDRPVFNQIMRRIGDRESGGVVVYKLDRFARTLVGGLTTLNELTDHRALFASATEPLFDFTTADGRVFLQINLMMAEYFRERTREGWETSLSYAVGRGVHLAPDVPYGYQKGREKRLAPDSSRAPFVLRAFELRVEGWPFQRIADHLNEHAYVGVADSDALSEALAEAEAAREDLEATPRRCRAPPARRAVAVFRRAIGGGSG